MSNVNITYPVIKKVIGFQLQLCKVLYKARKALNKTELTAFFPDKTEASILRACQELQKNGVIIGERKNNTEKMVYSLNRERVQKCKN